MGCAFPNRGGPASPPLSVWHLPILNDFSKPHPGLPRSPPEAARGLMSNRSSESRVRRQGPVRLRSLYRSFDSTDRMDPSPSHTRGSMIRLWLNSATSRDIYRSMARPCFGESMMASNRLVWSANSEGGEESQISERTLRDCRYLLKISCGRRSLASIKACFTLKRFAPRLRE